MTDGCCGRGGAFGAVIPVIAGSRFTECEGDACANRMRSSPLHGCLLQLRDLVAHLGSATPVLHPAALFADVSAD
jgi:hypothetical protein